MEPGKCGWCWGWCGIGALAALGLALADYYAGVSALYGKLSDARTDVDAAVDGARDRATYYKLTALDRESLVVLGDPTVLLPPLPSQAGG